VQHVHLLLDWLEQNEMLPTPRMRECISCFVPKGEKEALIQRYFQMVSFGSSDSVWNYWLSRGELKEAIHWLKRSTNATEEDRLLCLLQLSRKLKPVLTDEYRHKANSENANYAEFIIPHKYRRKEVFGSVFQQISVECDIDVETTRAGWKIKGIKPEREKAVEMLRKQCEDHNHMSYLPKGLSFVNKMFDKQPEQAVGLGGVYGQDEVHLWGNPFLRHQKKKEIFQEMDKFENLIEVKSMHSYISTIQDSSFPLAGIEIRSGAKFIFPSENDNPSFYIVGTSSEIKQALLLMFSLNPPVGDETCIFTSKPVDTLRKKAQSEVSILDFQWINNRLTSSEGKEIASILHDIYTGKESVNHATLNTVMKSTLSDELKRDVLECVFDMLLGQGRCDTAINLLQTHTDLLSATNWQHVLHNLIINMGGFEHRRKVDALYVSGEIEKLLYRLRDKFDSENLLTPESICELIYLGYMEAHPKICENALSLARNHCIDNSQIPQDIYKWFSAAQLKSADECHWYKDSDLYRDVTEHYGRSFLKTCRKLDTPALSAFLQDSIFQIKIDRLAVGLAKVGNVNCIKYLFLKLDWLQAKHLCQEVDTIIVELINSWSQDKTNIKELNSCIEYLVQFLIDNDRNLSQDTFTEVVRHYTTTEDMRRLNEMCDFVLERSQTFSELADVINRFPHLKAHNL